MGWAPSSASFHTGLANTKARQKFWARVANAALSKTKDEQVAIAHANRALFHKIDRDVTRRIEKSYAPQQPRLF